MEDRETELTFTREFGRTLTFLYRSRAKYMGERLRDLRLCRGPCS